MRDSSRTRRRQGPAWLLTLVVGILFSVPAAAQFGNAFEAMHDDSSSGSAYLSDWDEVDAAIDLTGLWGSIDTDVDKDPAWTVRPEDGQVYLAWSRWNGQFYEIVYAERPSGGAWSGWLKAESTPSSTYDNVAATVVTDAQGRLHVAWVREGATDGVLHSARLGLQWTVPLLISGTEAGTAPRAYLENGFVRVEYRTATALLTVEIVIYTSAGGSDDVDPGTNVEVEATEVGHEVLVE